MNKAKIYELQKKAMAGDKESLDIYNEYVQRGLAPRLFMDKTKSSLHSIQLMAEGYRVEYEKRGEDESFYTEPEEKPLHEKIRTPYTLISHGLTVREEQRKAKQMKAANKQGSYQEAQKRYDQQTKTKMFSELVN